MSVINMGKTRLFVSSERSKEELKTSHRQTGELDQARQLKLILDDESAGRELFPILTQGQYIAPLTNKLQQSMKSFKLESGVKV